MEVGLAVALELVRYHFAVFRDETYEATTRYVKGDYIFEKSLPYTLNIHTIYFFLSNDGELAIYVDADKVFPTEGNFNVVGAMVKIDLPKPLRIPSGKLLRVWFKNNSGTTMRVIYGIVGVYE